MVTERKLSRRLTWKKKLLFTAVVLLVALFVIESGMRVVLAFSVGPRVLLYGTSYHRNKINSTPEDDHTVMYHENARSGYTKYFPNETKVERDPDGAIFPVTINSRGFRGREFTEEKPPGVLRVVTLGASSTFGYYDRENETYPYYLEQRLKQESQSDTSFEVINLGIPHLHSEEILALFRAEALPLHLDVVTFYEGINDSIRMKKTAGQAARGLRQRFAGISWLRGIYRETRERLLTVALVDSVLTDTGVVTYSEKYFQEHVEGKSEHFLKNISALLSECEERGIVFIVANQQARSMTIEDVAGMTYAEEVKQIQEKLRREGRVNKSELEFLTHEILTSDLESWARSNDVPFVDIIESLDRNRDVLVSSVHLRPRGNQMIAEGLAREIRRQLALR